MNHAFLIEAHNNPLLLARSLKILEAPNHYFFINIDGNQNFDPFLSALRGIGNVLLLNDSERIKVTWGGVSQIICELLLLQKAYTHPATMEYFHMISGSDFPCKSNQEIDGIFEKANGRSFMKFDKEEEVKEWKKKKYPSRYRYYFFADKEYSPCRAVNLLSKPLSRVQSNFYTRPAIKGVRGGWNWFSWNRNVVAYVLDYMKSHPEYLKRFYYTRACDEIIFHTLLWSKRRELNIETQDALRYIEWHPKRHSDSLPLILEESEFDDIIHSNAIFCRKVDPVKSSKLLDLLEQAISCRE